MSTRYALICTFLSASSLPSFAQTIYSNGTFTTGIGNGANGTNTSVIGVNPTNGTAGTTFGLGHATSGPNRLADDFVVPSGEVWNITGITHFGYVTATYSNPPATPFTTISLNIRDLPPTNPLSTVLFSSTTINSNIFSGTHRATTTTLTNAQRPVFGVEAGFSGVSLNPGTYWIDVQLNAGFAPPATVFDPIDNRAEIVPGNALQLNSGVWGAVSDAGAGVQVTLPFQIQGAVVPEPTCVAGVALLGLLSIRRYRATV